MAKGKNGFGRPRLEAEVLAESEDVSRQLTGVGRTFASLAHRDYLIFWGGSWVSNIGTWLQMIAVGWLVLEMTDSSLYLGLVNFAMSIPVFFLSFSAGILADRLDKRKLIILMQVILMILAFILGSLVFLENHTIFTIMLLTFLGGCAFTFVFPAWQAMISEIVPPKDLLNAIALNSAQFHAARLIGPPLAGFVIAVFGIAECFFLNAFSFITVIIALLFIRPCREEREEKSSRLEDLRQGVKYALENKMVLYLLAGVGVVSVFGLSFYSVLMPKFARDILHGDSTTFGFLMGANGFGALAGALAVAYISYTVRRATIIRYGMLTLSLVLMVFAFSKNIYLSMAAMAVTGFSFLGVMSTLNTSLQIIVPQSMRGRIMSFYVWMFMGWMPLGSLLAGVMAHYTGAPRAVGLAAVVPLLLAVYLFVRFPQIEAPKALDNSSVDPNIENKLL